MGGVRWTAALGWWGLLFSVVIGVVDGGWSRSSPLQNGQRSPSSSSYNTPPLASRRGPPTQREFYEVNPPSHHSHRENYPQSQSHPYQYSPPPKPSFHRSSRSSSPHRQHIHSIPSSFSDRHAQVCSRLSLSGVISHFTDLEDSSAGPRTVCPFHPDNDPSLLINEGPGYFYCFACGASGSAVQWVSKWSNRTQSEILSAMERRISNVEELKRWLLNEAEMKNVDVEKLDLRPLLASPEAFKEAQEAMMKRGLKSGSSLARRSLHSDASTELSTIESTPPPSPMYRKALLSMQQQCARYFTARLLLDPEAAPARQYLSERNISIDTIVSAKLGYSPTALGIRRSARTPIDSLSIDSQTATALRRLGIRRSDWKEMYPRSLTTWLLECSPMVRPENVTKVSNLASRRQKVELLAVELGLSINGTSTDDSVSNHLHTSLDRFRHRLMIPIMDHSGSVIGFGARQLPFSSNSTRVVKMAKYINSPASHGTNPTLANEISSLLTFITVFRKRNVLYRTMRSGGDSSLLPPPRAVLVEGYFDAIHLTQAGVRGVMATMGTAVTLPQLLQASLATRGEILLLMDGDSAGALAAERATEVLNKFISKVSRSNPQRQDIRDMHRSVPTKTLAYNPMIDTQNKDSWTLTLKVGNMSSLPELIQKHWTTDKQSQPDTVALLQPCKDAGDLCERCSPAQVRQAMSLLATHAKTVLRIKDLPRKVLEDELLRHGLEIIFSSMTSPKTGSPHKDKTDPPRL